MIAECMDVQKTKAKTDFTLLCDTLQGSFIELSHEIEYPQIGPLLRKIDTSDQTGSLDSRYTDTLKYILETITGIELTKLATKAKDVTVKMSMQEDAEELFRTGSEFNELTGKHYLATILFHAGKNQTVASVLEETMHNFTRKQLLYAGIASSTTSIQVDHLGFIEEGTFTSYSEDASPSKNAVFDVVFSSRDNAFVPYPLKFECALLTSRSACIHRFISTSSRFLSKYRWATTFVPSSLY